jgi:cellulose synthase/poly-beta-1,6-N-acetylglucosamine synthase-like glycosyltransferase
LGLSCILGGTGFIISTRVLRELGWGATCLAEDLEFSLKLALMGKKVFWAHDAVIYDEKPLTVAQSWRQRKRWMQGHFDCSRRFLGALLKKAFTERSIIALDLSLYLIQPLIVVINGLGLLTGPIYLAYVLMNKTSFDLRDFLVLVLSFASMYLSIIFVIIEGKLKSLRILKYLLLMPIYNLTWVPIIIQGFLDKDKKEWSHTVHTRNMDISDIEKIKEAQAG